MLELIVASLANIVIECNDIQGNKNVAEALQIKSCEKLKDYEKVTLTAIKKRTHREVESNSPGGYISVSEPFAGRMTVVSTSASENYVETVTYLFSIEAYKTVWVSKTIQRAGESIKEGNVLKRQLNVAPFIGVKAVSTENPTGAVVTELIQRNGIIFNDKIKKKSLVERGDVLPVLILSGAIRLETKGVALKAVDHIDEKIEIRIHQTGVVINGMLKQEEYMYVEI